MVSEFTERDGENIRVFRYNPEHSLFFRTARQDVAILDTVLFGRTLFLDGVLQSAEKDEQIYHRALVHSAMGHVKDIQLKNILILGGGEGATLREVLKWPTQKVTMIDWDRELVEHFRNHEVSWHRGSFLDERVNLEFRDVFEVIGERRSYGVIIVDLVDPDLTEARWNDLFRTLVSWIEPGGCMIVNAGGVLPWEFRHVTDLEQALREEIGSQGKVFKFKKWIPSFGREWAFIHVKRNVAPVQNMNEHSSAYRQEQ